MAENNTAELDFHSQHEYDITIITKIHKRS